MKKLLERASPEDLGDHFHERFPLCLGFRDLAVGRVPEALSEILWDPKAAVA